MLSACANKDLSLGAGVPTWQLLSIRDGLVKDVNWTAPDMEVLKLGVGPACLREEVMGTQSGRFVGHLIVKEGSMLDSEGPEASVGNFRPVDCGMQHHRSCNRHHGLDALFGNTVVMVCSNTCQLGHLCEVL